MKRVVQLLMCWALVSGCDAFREDVGDIGEACSDNGQCREGVCKSGWCVWLNNEANPTNPANPVSPTHTGGVTGTVDLSWISITGGSYQMGSTGVAEPVHTVNVQTFEMTKTEVTVAQYLGCTQASGCGTPSTGLSCNWGVSGKDSHPVNCVNWSQAVAFCSWAGGRLPSEAEWEYAARGRGQIRTYPWGEQTPSCTYAVMDDAAAGGAGCGTGGTMAVCSKTPGNTAQGLCDMAGNVWEWVQDWYHDSYTGAPADGSSWETPAGSSRVSRGGSWLDISTVNLRASNRYFINPEFTFDNLGFRCARRL